MTLSDTAAGSAIHGLVLRPYAGEADLPDLVRIQNAEWVADGLSYRETVAERAAWYRNASAQFDPARDVTIAEIDGRPVGYTKRDWVDTHDGVREHRTGGAVDPDWRRRGIGTALLRDSELRSAALAASQPTERPLVIGCFTGDRNAGAVALARREGFEAARWFFDMERPAIDGDLPEIPTLPEGIEVRPVEESQFRAIWRADIEAFRDHWGGGDESDEAFRRYQEAPDFDPSLWVVAWDGPEVAAACVNTIYREENASLAMKRGWLDSVFTRRPWRKRGLASALIARSLHVLAGRGMQVAALGVDADNPSGALRLYESFGFAVTERGTAWRKPLEAVVT
ncbi:MAG: GNAT family N-acetyltransferase [Candidatus Limnocylindria bacterium]